MSRTLYPEFYRICVGFDSLFELVTQNDKAPQGNKYPPHNIVVLEEGSYILELAIAGFKKEEIKITHHKGSLNVIGSRAKSETEPVYAYNGISTRSFQKTFNTAEHVHVTGAVFEDGILSISVKLQVPESEKPKQIKIK